MAQNYWGRVECSGGREGEEFMEIFSEEVTDQTEQLADIPDLIKKKKTTMFLLLFCLY